MRFFNRLKKLGVKLKDNHGIVWPDSMVLTTAVFAKYKSGTFTKDNFKLVFCYLFYIF